MTVLNKICQFLNIQSFDFDPEINKKFTNFYPPMEKRVKERLINYYLPLNEKLAEFLQNDL